MSSKEPAMKHRLTAMLHHQQPRNPLLSLRDKPWRRMSCHAAMPGLPCQRRHERSHAHGQDERERANTLRYHCRATARNTTNQTK
eukprot:5444289-Lingulodinium_polyedra.AAC.1